MITKNYIKMCEGAEEIQKAWKPKEGDRFFWKSYNSTAGEMKINKLCIVGIGETEEVESWWNCIYLPTQEQLLNRIMSSNCYPIKIGDTKYCQNENFGIKIFKQFGHYNIVLENSPSEFAYNWITWKEDSLSECLLDVYMFRLYYKYWHNEKWIVGMWNREDRQFNPIKEKGVKAK